MRNSIEEIMKNNNVLLIPVYSTRSYKTGIYDLAADGNVTKFLMKIVSSKAKSIDMFYPRKQNNLSFIVNFLEKWKINNVNLIPFDYGENAHETRNMGKIFFEEIKRIFEDKGKIYDVIISEVDTLAQLCLQKQYIYFNDVNFAYWAGSWNADGTFWNCEGHEELNKKIAEKIVTPCLLEGQQDLYKGRSFYDVCAYNPLLFEKATIFFPFRLSDKSYKAHFFAETINAISEYRNDFVVLYTDPNDSQIFEQYRSEKGDVFKKVPCDKYVYLSILKGKPIVPYFDNPDINYHTNIFELIYYNCDIITFENNLCKSYENAGYKNITYISELEEFKNALERKIDFYVK